jgi:hypothetical protein
MKSVAKRRTFGPAIISSLSDEPSPRATCTWCVFRIGEGCTHKSPSKIIPDPGNTPEWCEMLESMLRDAKEAETARKPSSPRID